MTPEQLIEHFETGAEVARALRVGTPSVSEWKARGVVPIDRQCQAEIITRGKLKADRSALPIERQCFVEVVTGGKFKADRRELFAPLRRRG